MYNRYNNKKIPFITNGTTKYGIASLSLKAKLEDSPEEILLECMKNIPKYFNWESIEFDFENLHYYVAKEWLFETGFN